MSRIPRRHWIDREQEIRMVPLAALAIAMLPWQVSKASLSYGISLATARWSLLQVQMIDFQQIQVLPITTVYSLQRGGPDIELVMWAFTALLWAIFIGFAVVVKILGRSPASLGRPGKIGGVLLLVLMGGYIGSSISTVAAGPETFVFPSGAILCAFFGGILFTNEPESAGVS